MKKFFNARIDVFLWLGIFAYIIVFNLLGIWKYHNFGYNGLDLAIFNQTFYNTSLGNIFKLTIHEPTYLNDHFPPFMLLLVIFYLPFKHPLALILMQNIAIALTAIPIFLIAKNIVNKKWALIISLSFLANPFVQNISLYEFHMLSFALPLILFAFYFFQKNNFYYFLIFSCLSLLVREDIALVIFMFGVLALFKKRKLKWALAPVIISLLYFALALKIISCFNEIGSYKYLIYYSWLGNSNLEIAKNIFQHLDILALRFFGIKNIEFILGLFLPCCFLPLLKPRYLLLALPIYLQLFLGAPGTSDLVFQTQYVTLFLPAIFIAFIFGVKKIINQKFLIKQRGLILILIITATIYSNIIFGPFWGAIYKIYKNGVNPEITQIKNQLLKQIPKKSAVAASFEFLTKASSRENIYSLNYFFTGKTQFGQTNYELPENTEYFLINFSDFLKYESNSQKNPLYKENFSAGDNRFRDKIAQNNFGVIKVFDDLAILKKNSNSQIKLYEIYNQMPEIENQQNTALDDQIIFIGFDKNKKRPNLQPTLEFQSPSFSFYWQSNKIMEKNYALNFILKDANDKIAWQKIYPLAYGLYPTTEWRPNEIIKTNHWFYVDTKKIPNGTYKIEIQLMEIIDSGLYLDASRSAIFKINEFKPLGKAITITEAQL